MTNRTRPPRAKPLTTTSERTDQAEHPTEILTVRIPIAMRMTGIGRSKFYQLIAAKQVEIVKLGSSTLVVVPSLKRFIESLRR